MTPRLIENEREREREVVDDNHNSLIESDGNQLLTYPVQASSRLQWDCGAGGRKRDGGGAARS
jgi:hypothetical protein